MRRNRVIYLLTTVLIVLLAAGGATAEAPYQLYEYTGDVNATHLDADYELLPSDLGKRWEYISYIPDGIENNSNFNSSEVALGSGVSADLGWMITAGDPNTLIATFDSGYYLDRGDIYKKLFLNKHELAGCYPLNAGGNNPGGAGSPVFDIDGNGLFNCQDYDNDPRFQFSDDARPNGPFGDGQCQDFGEEEGRIDVRDIIHCCSDGVDNDGNGFVDDIAGWDFFWDDNDPYDNVGNGGQGYSHGTQTARLAVAGANDGGDIGMCPNCMVLPLRVSDSFIADADNFAMAVVYAVDQGAGVIAEALGSVNCGSFCRAAIDYAYYNNVIHIGSAADETSMHQNQPGATEHGIYTHSIRFDANEYGEKITSFLHFSNSTNYGARLQLSTPSLAASSGAVGLTGGLAGLIVSRGVEIGLTPILSANEIQQILLTTVDDINIPGSDTDESKFPSHEGWEPHHGYGRTNIRKALEMVAEGTIPPEADILEPRWFDVKYPDRTPTIEITGYANARRADSFTWTLSWAPGIDPLADDFTVITSGTSSEAVEGVLGELDITEFVAQTEPKYLQYGNVDEFTNKYTATLLLEVVDSADNRGEFRKAFYIHQDPDLFPAFPIATEGSIESSPKMADFDGDGDYEVVVVDNSGYVHLLQHDGTEMPGFPARTGLQPELDPNNPNNHLALQPYADGEMTSEGYCGSINAPAIGDLDGDGTLEIVVPTLCPSLYVYNSDGSVRDGFPAHTQFENSYLQDLAIPGEEIDNGFFSAPVLYDLDGNGDLEIIAAGLDGWMYVFDDDGSNHPGFPVQMIDPQTTSLCRFEGEEPHNSRIVSTPAVGDANADGLPDILVGTNEIYGGGACGRGYMMHGDGNNNASGSPFHPNWPMAPAGVYVDILPYIGRGVSMGPIMAQVDSDPQLEFSLLAIGSFGFIYDHDTTEITQCDAVNFGALSNSSDAPLIQAVNNPSFGDIDQDGVVELVNAGFGTLYAAARLNDGTRIEYDHLIGAWNARTGESMKGFPRKMEDWQFFMNPAIADLDGDGFPEVINGSGGFYLHAFNNNGLEPEGWPKFTGQWILGSPAVGDVDGDGYLDVAVTTRSGYIYIWSTKGPADGVIEWNSFHHDNRNTGNYETPIARQAGPSASKGSDDDGGCGCRPTSGANGLGSILFFLLLLPLARLTLRRFN